MSDGRTQWQGEQRRWARDTEHEGHTMRVTDLRNSDNGRVSSVGLANLYDQ
jgi:hypothetical protein